MGQSRNKSWSRLCRIFGALRPPAREIGSQNDIAANEKCAVAEMYAEIGDAVAVHVASQHARRGHVTQFARVVAKGCSIDEGEGLITNDGGVGVDSRNIDLVGSRDEIADVVAGDAFSGFFHRMED